MCRRRCRSGPRWPGLAPVSCARRPERPIEHAVSLRAKEVGLCGVHGVLCGSPTLARSTDYIAIRPKPGARLRITTDSASSALCGAPHNAEFERELIHTRTGEGRARAKAAGKSLGRRSKLTPHQKQEALRRRDEGQSVREIARSYNVSASTISRLTA